MLKDWNVLVIGNKNTERELLKELEEAGEFERSGFRDVIIGNVDDIVEFMEEAEEGRYKNLSRVIPIEDAFFVSPENLVEILKKKVAKYIDAIEPTDTFAVRIERRGMKGEIRSQEVEREIGGYLYDLLEKTHGKKPKVNLKDPDKLIAIEMIGNRCGIGFITKEMREKYNVLRVR
ncbi:MAG: THUMP domain-containing protein [Candidatus Methanospirareceae archaeon]